MDAQDKVVLMGVEYLDSLRCTPTGLESYFLILSTPSKATRPTRLPCTIFGKQAEEFDKLVKSGLYKGDFVNAVGHHRNVFQNKGKSWRLEIQLTSIEKCSPPSEEK